MFVCQCECVDFVHALMCVRTIWFYRAMNHTIFCGFILEWTWSLIKQQNKENWTQRWKLGFRNANVHSTKNSKIISNSVDVICSVLKPIGYLSLCVVSPSAAACLFALFISITAGSRTSEQEAHSNSIVVHYSYECMQRCVADVFFSRLICLWLRSRIRTQTNSMITCYDC